LDERVSRRLRSFLRDSLAEEVGVQYEWAGIMGMTRDGLPIVGPLPWAPRVGCSVFALCH
jgi:glycine/D-amino acid oxidase-like deaminating enzyme